MRWILGGFAALMVVGCGNDKDEVECRINSDCPGVLLCNVGRCMVECKTAKDCHPTGTCGGGFCSFPECTSGGGCNGGSCVSGSCVPESFILDGDDGTGADATDSGTGTGSDGGTDTGGGPCGNSPVYGKWLWEIGGCKLGLEMREDCQIGSKALTTNGSSYSGLDIFMVYPSGQKRHLRLYDERFVTDRFDPNDPDDQIQIQKYNAINAKLDKYHGYALLAVPPDSWEGTLEHYDDNAFVPLDAAYESKGACRESPYYWKN